MDAALFVAPPAPWFPSFETAALRPPQDEATTGDEHHPHGEEVQSTVSNHEAATVHSHRCTRSDAASRNQV
jgi:hypothetical protein